VKDSSRIIHTSTSSGLALPLLLPLLLLLLCTKKCARVVQSLAFWHNLHEERVAVLHVEAAWQPEAWPTISIFRRWLLLQRQQLGHLAAAAAASASACRPLAAAAIWRGWG
jgi:hypothetical protein